MTLNAHAERPVFTGAVRCDRRTRPALGASSALVARETQPRSAICRWTFAKFGVESASWSGHSTCVRKSSASGHAYRYQPFHSGSAALGCRLESYAAHSVTHTSFFTRQPRSFGAVAV